jgi:hypothetical protein
MSHKALVGLLLAVPLAAFALEARADSVNLVGSWSLAWDVNLNPAESPSVTIQIENAAASSNRVFNGYDLGLKFNRLSGSGEIALGGGSNPTVNSIVPSWFYPIPLGGAAMNTDTLLNVAYDNSLDYSVPDTLTDLVLLEFVPGPTPPAPGSVFQVLSDFRLSDYVDHLGNSTPYANNVTQDFVLGTITVTPEPSSLVLGVAALAFGIVGRIANTRRRNQPTSVSR